MARIDIKSAGGGGSVATGVLQLQGGVAMSSTLTAVTDQNNTTSPLKLSTTAVQVVSPLRITTDDPSDMYLDCEDGATNNRFNITRNTASQQVNLNFASNPGGSTTIVGAIRTYVDGVNLSEVMSFREDGYIGIGTNAPTQPVDIVTTGQIPLKLTSTQSFVRTFYSNSSANGTFDLIDNYFSFGANNLVVGSSSNLNSRFAVKGSGSTSATTSLLVQNSGGSQALKVDDSLRTTVQTLNILSTYPSLYIGSANMLDYGDGLRVGYDAAVTKVTLYTNGGTPQLQVNNSGQVSVGTTSPNASAKFQIDSTTLGFLPPRMTTTQKNAIASPAAGLMVYDTTLNKLCVYTTAWETITSI